jgi:hypothetical protein
MAEFSFPVSSDGEESGHTRSARFSEARRHAPEPGVPTRQDLCVGALQTSYPGIVCSVCLSDCEHCLEEIARWGC